MAELLKGAPVAAAINEKTLAEVTLLKERGIIPTLAILQVGHKEADIAYASNAKRKCASLGIEVRSIEMPADVTEEDFLKEVVLLNEDESVHGVLILSPLPHHIDDDKVRAALKAEKDVDGITDISLGGVFTGHNIGFAPCTAEACMKMLEFYDINLKGKNVCVIGHSRVVGRPAALMALCHDATVSICHVFTKDSAAFARQAEIIIVAVGKAGLVTKEYLAPGQIVIDVGINVNAEGKLCGDLNEEEADSIVKAFSPVPGGVGTVTTAVLMSHVVTAAERQS